VVSFFAGYFPIDIPALEEADIRTTHRLKVLG